MTDYTITTNFGAKDSLPSGNAGKVIKGEEFTTEFTNIQTAVNTKADTAGDTFTGAVNFSADVAVNTNTLFVDVSEANVGIGTTNPAGKLHVEINDNTAYSSANMLGGTIAQYIFNTSDTDGTHAVLGFGVDGTSTDAQAAIGATYTDAGDGALVMGTRAGGNVTERMRIDSSGNVGIGTASPVFSSGYLGLQVNGGTASQLRLTNSTTGATATDGLAVSNDVSASYLWNYEATPLILATSSAERLRIDASGNVGIGTNSPADELHLNDSKSGGDVSFRIQNSAVTSGDTATLRFSVTSDVNHDSAFIGSDRSNSLIFGADLQERMRIDASGNLLVGKTSYGVQTQGFGAYASGAIEVNAGNATAAYFNRTTGDGELLNFRKDGTTVGSIGTAFVSGSRYFYIGSTANNVNTGIGFYDQGIYASNSTGSFSSGNKNLGSSTVRWLTAYLTNSPNVSSDQRLKQNIEDADDAGSTIDAIQVRKFDWIADGRHQKYGMIAQEVAEVYPEAVNVPENEEDTLGIATGDLIPMLIKEVQSLRSRVAELENV